MKKNLIGIGVVICIIVGSIMVLNNSKEQAKDMPKKQEDIQKINVEKPIESVISEELRKKGYQIAGVGTSYQGKKEISVRIQGSNHYYNDVKEDVESIANDILNSRKYDAYPVKVSRYKEYQDEVDPREEKKMKQYHREYEIIHAAATEELKEREYNVLSLMMSYSPKTIEIEIPNTETRIDEIKQVINDVLQTNKIDPIPLKIKKVDMKKRDQDRRWSEILSLVGEDLMGKKEFKVTGLAFSVYPEPEIIIKTSINSSDPNAKEFAEQLEKIIDEFLKSEDMKSKVKNDSYIITIRSKDKKKINKNYSKY